MSIETPEHWNGETKRFADMVATGAHAASEKAQASGMLAIATELADLRKALTEPNVEVRVDDGAWQNTMRNLLNIAADEAGVPHDLLPKEHETSRYALEHNKLPAGSELRHVGWYCPGGHPIENTFHDLAGKDPVLADPGLRLEDPCEWGVPVYVLTKKSKEPCPHHGTTYLDNNGLCMPSCGFGWTRSVLDELEHSPGAKWQQRMMEISPENCWIFTSPVDVCAATQPCPRHKR